MKQFLFFTQGAFETVFFPVSRSASVSRIDPVCLFLNELNVPKMSKPNSLLIGVLPCFHCHVSNSFIPIPIILNSCILNTFNHSLSGISSSMSTFVFELGRAQEGSVGYARDSYLLYQN